MKKGYLIILAICLCLNLSVRAQTLHAIIYIPDCNSRVEKALERDSISFYSHMQTVADEIGYNFSNEVIHSNDIFSAIKGMKCHKNDIIYCYIGVAAFRNEADNDSVFFPHAFVEKNISMQNAISLDSVKNLIINKKSRLSIILAQCSNTFLNDSINKKYQKKIKSRVINSQLNMAPNNNDGLEMDESTWYRTLFLNQKGNILVCSSSPGEYAWVRTEIGSIFALCYLECMNPKYKCSWDSILENVKLTTRVMSKNTTMNIEDVHEQNPMYEINLTKY